MKVVAFVPIKMNNERLPGKNTKMFSDGMPLIQSILQALSRCKELDDVYVYCSNESIKEYLIDDVNYLKRDSIFDSQSVNVNDMFFAFSQIVDADIYVLAHATAPFLKPESIDTGITAVKSGEYDSAIAVRKLQEFLWKNGKPVNYDTSNIPRTQDLDLMYVETTGLYIFTRDVIVNKHSRVGDNPFMLEVTEVEATDINNPIDFDIADAIRQHIILPRLMGGGRFSGNF